MYDFSQFLSFSIIFLCRFVLFLVFIIYMYFVWNKLAYRSWWWWWWWWHMPYAEYSSAFMTDTSHSEQHIMSCYRLPRFAAWLNKRLNLVEATRPIPPSLYLCYPSLIYRSRSLDRGRRTKPRSVAFPVTDRRWRLGCHCRTARARAPHPFDSFGHNCLESRTFVTGGHRWLIVVHVC